jgi:hypothetical protein
MGFAQYAFMLRLRTASHSRTQLHARAQAHLSCAPISRVPRPFSACVVCQAARPYLVSRERAGDDPRHKPTMWLKLLVLMLCLRESSFVWIIALRKHLVRGRKLKELSKEFWRQTAGRYLL